MSTHNILVEFTVEGSTVEAARFWLQEHLQEPDGIVTSARIVQLQPQSVVGRHELAKTALQAATDLYSASVMDGQPVGGAPRQIKDAADDFLEWLEQRS